MKRSRIIIVIVLLIAAWTAAEWLLHQRTVPPKNVTNIDSFLKWHPGTERFTVLTSDSQHVIATGGGGALLPSGPSAYVFDRSGQLIDWSSDIGDDSKFDEKWQAQHSLGSGKSMSRAALSTWLTPATKPAR